MNVLAYILLIIAFLELTIMCVNYKHEKQELKTEYILKCVELKHVSDNVMTCSNLKIHRVINKDVLKDDGTGVTSGRTGH